MAPPPEQRLDVALRAARRLRRVHVGANAGEALEVALDVGAGLRALDAELIGETEGRDAVDDAEIDRLGAAAHVARHRCHRHREHFRRRHRVDVVAAREGLLQLRDVGDVRQQPQLDLRIVGRHQHVARRRDEGRADLAPRLVAHRYVLQVRLGGGQTTRRRRGELVGGVDAAVRVHVIGQGVAIIVLQLGRLAPFEHLARERVAFLGKILQHAGGGRPGARRGLARARQPHAAKQDVAELLRRADVEARVCHLVDLGLEPFGLLAELTRKAA